MKKKNQIVSAHILRKYSSSTFLENNGPVNQQGEEDDDEPIETLGSFRSK